jgi:hypothetical protein
MKDLGIVFSGPSTDLLHYRYALWVAISVGGHPRIGLTAGPGLAARCTSSQSWKIKSMALYKVISF